MTRKRHLRAASVVALTAVAALLVSPAASHAQPGSAQLERARSQVNAGHYAAAESTLTRLSRGASGDVLDECQFMLAGLQRDGRVAEAMYRRVIDHNPRSEWAVAASLEQARIAYSLGEYNRAQSLLEGTDACGKSDEACLIVGLSAIGQKDYDGARRSLERIRRGKQRTWAFLALAEVDAASGDTDAACSRYDALASAMISPTAVYRHGECLEALGKRDAALEEFRAVIANFPGTPEAVLSAEKLQRIPESAAAFSTPAVAVEPSPEERPMDRGFTIQFGSFRDRGNAIKLASRIKRVYPGVRVDSELVSYREYHRVRFGYYATREQAQARGEELARDMGEDFTVMTLP